MDEREYVTKRILYLSARICDRTAGDNERKNAFYALRYFANELRLLTDGHRDDEI